MKKCIAVVTCLLVLVAIADVPAQDTAGKRVVFMPFLDDSGYRGPWDLKWEVPVMLGDMLGGTDEYFSIVPIDTVRSHLEKSEERNIFMKFVDLFRNKKRPQIRLSENEVLSLARRLDADIAITGRITDFNFTRRGGGDPMIGGYKHYKSSVAVDQVRILRVADGRALGTVNGEDSKTEQGLGLELFGKSRDMDLEFYSLDSLDFGSKRYLATMMGQTTVEALNNVHREIRGVIARPDSSWFVSKQFKVLSIEGGIATINAGSGDGVSAGDRFNVFASESGVRVGKVNVIQVWSDHLARTEILDGQDEIRVNDLIMPEM